MGAMKPIPLTETQVAELFRLRATVEEQQARIKELEKDAAQIDERMPDFYISELSMNTIKYNAAVHGKQYFSKNKYEDCVIPVYFAALEQKEIDRD